MRSAAGLQVHFSRAATDAARPLRRPPPGSGRLSHQSCQVVHVRVVPLEPFVYARARSPDKPPFTLMGNRPRR